MAFKNFNWLDHLQNMEMDLTDYLEKFSSADVNLKFRNIQPVIATVANLFEQSQLMENFKNEGTSYVVTNIREGQLPEDLALSWYGSEDFWWVITLFNEIKDPLTDWPLNEEQLNYLTDLFVIKENKYSRKAYYDIMFEINEGKRSIDILKREQLHRLINQYKQIVKEDTKPTTNKFTILL